MKGYIRRLFAVPPRNSVMTGIENPFGWGCRFLNGAPQVRVTAIRPRGGSAPRWFCEQARLTNLGSNVSLRETCARPQALGNP